MRLAILVTNTDDSAFARARPRDDEKFARLLGRVRPGWNFEAFVVRDGVFPDDPARFDGVIVTGSPASVNSGADWVARLLDLIRRMVAQGVPIFGACFGHQAIALAMGGRVGPNPGGWVHGLVRTETLARKDWTRDLADVVYLYASHSEQVTDLPAGAEILARSQDCPVAGFAIGNRVYTTQHHPEMTHDFIADLTGELAGKLGPRRTGHARASLARPADTGPFAESVARFFELASGSARTQ